MKAIKVYILVASASASTISAVASSVNERLRLRGMETIANESQRRVQEKGEKKSVAKESTVKEIANEIQELDDKIIKEEEELDDEKGVKEQLKELKHTKEEKGEKDVVDELTSDLNTIDIVIKADETQLKKDKSVKEELKQEKKEKKAKQPKEKKAKEEKIKEEKVKEEKAEEEKVEEEKVEEELVEKIHNVEVKEEIAFEELEDLETEIDSITIVNSKLLDTDNIETVVPSYYPTAEPNTSQSTSPSVTPTPVPSSKPTAKPTTSPSVTPTLQPVTTSPESELPTISPTLSPSYLVVDDITVIAGEMPACPLAYDKTKTSYKVGDLVTITDNIFECMSPYAVYCNIAEWDEALTATDQNAEDNWNTAWKYVSPCSGSVSVIDDPTTLAPSNTLSSLPTFSPTAVPTAEVITPEVVTPEVEVDPMPTPTCPPVYDITKTTYIGGDKVLITDNIFECHTLYVYYCNVATWDDALLTSDPNAEEAWNSAWVFVGPCS